MDRIDLVKQVFKLGYLSMIEQLLEKAVNLLKVEASTQSSKEMYRLVIEQSYHNLVDLVHFLEADGSELKELTCSQLVMKSFYLISLPDMQNLIASVKIMTAISGFFKELSQDNCHVKTLLTP